MKKNKVMADHTWLIDTRNHYKIWFSDNPNEFLNSENKLRLIRTCLQNPNLIFSFVYSSSILTRAAISDLIGFCNRLKIQPIDFDTHVLDMLEHESDKICYILAKKEIWCAVNQQGGNLAAASDLTRWLPGLISRCGIYSDFDVEINFSSLPVTLLSKSALILPTTITSDAAGLESYTINNEFLAFAKNIELPGTLDPESIRIIRATQTEIIKRYESPIFAMKFPVIPGFQSRPKNIPINIILDWFIQYKEDYSIFEFRSFVQQLNFRMLCDVLYYKVLPRIFDNIDINKLEESLIGEKIGQYILTRKKSKENALDAKETANNFLQKIKNELYKISVECISGPFVSMAVFKERLQSSDFGSSVFEAQIVDQQLFIKAMHDFSLTDNNLADCVLGQDHNAQYGKIMSDESWTENGKKNSAKRSGIINNAATIIQKTYKNKVKKK